MLHILICKKLTQFVCVNNSHTMQHLAHRASFRHCVWYHWQHGHCANILVQCRLHTQWVSLNHLSNYIDMVIARSHLQWCVTKKLLFI